jgi:type 1 glutamine amidotransferase
MATTGGTGGSSGGSAGSGGGANQPIGHFKMLVYYETRAFRHDSIPKGIQMLQELGAQNDFDVTISDGEQNDSVPVTMGDEDIITPEKLAPFDIVFFMNPTGDIFTDAEKTVFKDYLHQKKAFAGIHATTDTEHSWTWYEDLVGEIYDGHSAGTPSGTITIEEAQKNHPAMAGIQSPWTRNEEWYKFNNRINNGLPGVTILMRYGGPDSGGTIGQPLAWTREWEGIRSFYTAIGHAQSTWDEPLIRKHVLGGVLWAVGRLK